MIGSRIRRAVEREVQDFGSSQLEPLVSANGAYVIKFVDSRWAATYEFPGQLKISETPALTWGTATYVTPIAFSLSSALYGRIGLVTEFDPTGGIGVAIWVNTADTPDGPRPFRSITIAPRRYLDRESGEWKDASSYNPGDLPALIYALTKAQEYVFETPLPDQKDGPPDKAKEEIPF